TDFNPAVESTVWVAEIDASTLEPGFYSAQFQFVDGAGNSTPPVLRRFEVARTQYSTIEERLSPRAYLDALVQFIGDHAQIADGRSMADQLFYQQFSTLIGSQATVGEDRVNRLRIAIEVLRKYLAQEPAALVGHWKFDESTGGVAKDASAYDHNAVLNGAGWA